MNELIKELTQLAVTARTYLNLRAVKEGLISPAMEAAVAESGKDKLAPAPTRAPKREKAVEKPAETPAPDKSTAKTVAAALGAGEPSMSEKESLDAAFKLGTAFVQKDGQSKEKIEDNKAALRAYLEKNYNAKNLSGVPHPQRIEVVEWLKKQLEPKAEDALS